MKYLIKIKNRMFNVHKKLNNLNYKIHIVKIKNIYNYKKYVN